MNFSIFLRYIELNRKSYTQANELKVLYGDQLPTCLVNKPASVIVHVLDQIKTTESTVYQVTTSYSCNFNKSSMLSTMVHISGVDACFYGLVKFFSNSCYCLQYTIY